MTTLREAATHALEALESAVEYDYHGTPLTETHAGFNDAATALRAALAEPVQEPVAWQERQARRMRDGVVTEWTDWYPCRYRTVDEARSEASDHIPYEWRPLYAAPPQRPAEPVQDPVAWSYELATTMLEHRYDGWEHLITRYKPNVPEGSIRNLTPLYTSPPQRKPLSDDQLDDIAVAARRGNLYDLRIAIEQAHGVKERQ